MTKTCVTQSKMRKIYTDFTARLLNGDCEILGVDGAAPPANGLRRGEPVVLHDDRPGSEVEGTLAFRFVEEMGRWMWVATPRTTAQRRRA